MTRAAYVEALGSIAAAIAAEDVAIRELADHPIMAERLRNLRPSYEPRPEYWSLLADHAAELGRCDRGPIENCDDLGAPYAWRPRAECGDPEVAC